MRLPKSLSVRFAGQVAEDGTLPLVRTLSLHYSTFVLEAFSTARNGPCRGVGLWEMPEAQRALACLLPYYEKP